MRYPNSFGSVVRLGGKRRKRYAVRISCGYRQRICIQNKKEYYPIAIDKYKMTYRSSKNDYVMYCDDESILDYLTSKNCTYRVEFVRRYKYLEYFSKSAEAHAYLAQMNRGEAVQEHVSLAQEPTFADVYRMYIQFAKSLNKPPSEASLHSYATGFNLWSDVHDIRFSAVTTKQLQDCLTAHGTMSKSSVTRMLTVIKKMFKYALAHQITDTDLSKYLFSEYSGEKKRVHKIYTDDEIRMLWKRSDYEGAAVMLIMIYLGTRCTEFLELRTENIHLDERYLVGGIKTEAGRNRVIPLHKRIVPLIRRFYNPDNVYLFPSTSGNAILYSHFRTNKWDVYNKELGLDHLSHDCRHTTATKLEQYGVSDMHRKLILGHSLRDVTAIYTHVSQEALIADIDLWID